MISKFNNLLASVFIFAVMSLPLHEGGHSLAAQCFGVSGYIELDWFNFTGWFSPGPLNNLQWHIVGFAGGLFVAIIYGLLLFIAHIGQKWDEDDLFGLRLVLAVQLGYGIGEGLQIGWLAGLGAILGMIIASIYSLPKLFAWWKAT